MMTQQKTVLAMGFFDGVHIGHGALLKETAFRAAEKGGRAAVLSFDNHPLVFVKGEKVPLINSASDRAYIIRRYYGIETVFFLHFNESTMRINWRDFLDDIMREYNCCHFVVGHDFRFGFGGQGTAELLAGYCAGHELGCSIIPAVMADGGDVSSSRIRALLLAGDIDAANRLLGHPHLLTGTVRTGRRLGRTIQAPTINMTFADGVLVPKHGVYIAKARFRNEQHNAVLNIGSRPTFDGGEVTVETHVLDFEGDLYGEDVCVELYHYIRPERKFSSANELMLQIKSDAQAARTFFLEK